MGDPPPVLFPCVHDAGRSQMAAGWMRALAGDGVRVLSVGSEPTGRVNPHRHLLGELGVEPRR
ncbi:MAG TPA: hypothetical protein VK923_06515 [Euzebyales bacterium]|nr:hypothetical protein [Euzebyales bacterium]